MLTMALSALKQARQKTKKAERFILMMNCLPSSSGNGIAGHSIKSYCLMSLSMKQEPTE